MKVAGRLAKLFLLRFKSFNEDKPTIALMIPSSDRLQSLRSKVVKEHKPDKQGNIKPPEHGTFLGNNKDEKIDFHEWEDDPLHPRKDNV